MQMNIEADLAAAEVSSGESEPGSPHPADSPHSIMNGVESLRIGPSAHAAAKPGAAKGGGKPIPKASSKHGKAQSLFGVLPTATSVEGRRGTPAY